MALTIVPCQPQFEPPDGISAFYYESEESDGFEIGMKARLLDNAMRLNATAFSYEYSDFRFSCSIQQPFSSVPLMLQRSKLRALSLIWLGRLRLMVLDKICVGVDGYDLFRGFYQRYGENLKGERGAGSADITGFAGFTLIVPRCQLAL